MAPHAGKKFPDLETFMGLKGRARAARPALDLNTTMRKWVAITAFAQAQAKPARQS